MSVFTRCPQRIASTTTRHAVRWPRRVVRHYASQTANEPEWFQQARTELLGREPLYRCESLDALHQEQLASTVEGLVPEVPHLGLETRPTTPLAELLTRFNAQVPSSTLLPDGTDALHSPGGPWVRRMWAGGSVQASPSLRTVFETPFRLRGSVACLEHIKDVRLQGAGNAAKVFVTIERRFALPRSHRAAAEGQAEDDAQTRLVRQLREGVEWGDVLLKEQRNLVFLKAKTGAELGAVPAEQLTVPRYLRAPTNPDFSHALTPTRFLLFRYSALTFNAHLLHLDPTFARNVEGHRNLLVHGPLTLTLMLQILHKHLRSASSEIVSQYEQVDSIEYRNLAPLYCDEEMRVCVKNKKKKESGNLWDVWIEGPTGGMAVRAVVRTVDRRTAPTIQPAADTTSASARRKSLSNKTQRQLSPKDSRKGAARPLSYLYIASSPLVTPALPPVPQAGPTIRMVNAAYLSTRSITPKQQATEASSQSGTEIAKPKAQSPKAKKRRRKPVVIKKVAMLRVRRMDMSLTEAAAKREVEKRASSLQKKKALKSIVTAAEREATREGEAGAQ